MDENSEPMCLFLKKKEKKEGYGWWADPGGPIRSLRTICTIGYERNVKV